MGARLTGSILTLPARIREAQPAVDREVVAAAVEVVDAARARWPVKTGRSRAALSVLIRGHKVVVADRVPYAQSIESKGINPWRTYIVRPLLAAARTTLPRRMARALLGRLRGG